MASPRDSAPLLGEHHPEALQVLGSAATEQTASAAATARSKRRANFVGGTGNFSVQYNLSSLSVAVAFMTSGVDNNFPEPEWAKNTLLGTAFAGTLVGMLLFGQIADRVGRRTGMLLTLALVALGALGSALVSWGPDESVYGAIAGCRFLVGVGVGGIYPCAFATVAESSKDDEHENNQSLGWAYFWQMPGAMAPYAIGWALTSIAPSVTSISVQFRTVLAMGVVPAFIVWVATYTNPAPRTGVDADVSRGVKRPSPIAVAMANPQHFKTLIGTGGAWLLYDAAYYGTAIFTPAILKSIFGDSETLAQTCWHSLIVTGMTIPGTLMALWAMSRFGARWLCIWGFLLMAALFGTLGGIYLYAPNQSDLPWVKFAVFCGISLALGWGPSVGVHVLAAKSYPTEVRATFIGLSSASGKVGAIMGTFMYAPISDAAGLSSVMFIQVAFSIVGVLLSRFFIKCDKPGREGAPGSSKAAAAALGDSGLSTGLLGGYAQGNVSSGGAGNTSGYDPSFLTLLSSDGGDVEVRGY